MRRDRTARLAIVGALTACGLLLSGCASGGSTTSGARPTAAAPAAAAAAKTPAITKVLVFIEENHSLAQMSKNMPYAFSVARRYGYATHYTALTHPSLPNYLGIATGKTYGLRKDVTPAQFPIKGTTVFSQAIAHGKTAGIYADAMTANCQTVSHGNYAARHNVWTYFTNERAQCAKYDVPISKLSAAIKAGHLPNVGQVIPDLCNDAHNCTLATADAWFKTWMPRVLAGPDWKSGHLAVVLTADENDNSPGNTILTMLAYPSEKGRVVSTHLTHFSLTRLYQDVTGASYFPAAKTAPSLSKAFGFSTP
jgi:hypothetical protein